MACLFRGQLTRVDYDQDGVVLYCFSGPRGIRGEGLLHRLAVISELAILAATLYLPAQGSILGTDLRASALIRP